MSTPQIVFVALPASLMLLWLILAARTPRRIEAPNTIAVLRYGSKLRTLALAFALLLPMIMIYVIAVFPWGRDNRLTYAGAAYLATCLAAGLGHIEVSRGQVCITEDGVTRISPWKGRVTLQWIEVERVEYSSLNSVFVLIGAGRRIRVSRYLSGVKVFADTLKRKLATERFRPAITALETIR
jgi:hypothetical protein